MKHTLALLLALLLTPLAALPAAEPSIRLAENGVARHAIVMDSAETATAAERFAVEELALFLKKITGAAFPIVKEGEQTGPGIYVGHTRRAAKAGIDHGKLGNEEWVLLTAGEDLILTGGRPRGTLYAVYEFLDSKAGCRWIAPDIEIVPANRDFAIPALDVRGRPAFSWRETTLYPRHDDPKRISKEDYARLLVRNRYNGGHFNGGSFWLYEPRFGFSERFGRPGSSHTFSIYQEKWQDVKPEFFAMTEDGKRAPRPDGPLGHDFCLTNTELMERVAQQLQQYIEEDRAEAAKQGTPPPRLYAFSQNDTSSKYCRCPECSAIARREGSYAATSLAFVNDVAARIADKYPDVQLMTEAYQFTKRVPKTIRPRENVVVRLALLDLEYRADEIADVLRPLSAPTNRAAREVTEGWAAAVQDGQFFVWDYAQLRAPFRYPYDGTTKILKNIEYWHRLGIDRVFIEQAGIDLSFRPMRDWLFFRKTVHPELKDEVLIDEYLCGYFGPAAGPMRQYYERLAALTESGDKPYFETPASVIPWLNSEFYTQVNAWLDEAESLCAGEANAKHLRHVQLERVPVDSGLLHLWHRYAESPAWKGRKEEVLRRYEKNKRMLIQTWATAVHVWVNNGANAFDGELAALRLEPPARFEGRNANLRLVGSGAPPANLVKDPSAAGGQARRLGGGKLGDDKLPFQMKIHDDVAPRDWGAMTLAQDKVPQDEAWHWHLVGTAPLTGHCGLWSNVYIWLPIGWGDKAMMCIEQSRTAIHFLGAWLRMLRFISLSPFLPLSLSLVLLLSLTPLASAEEPVDYLKQIKPILRERCFACHGALKQAANLRLDTVGSASKGGDSGAAIQPGDAAASLLLERVIATDEAERMPQEGEPLTAAQLALLKRWISEGAKGPADEQPEADPSKHWAFQPIARPAVPDTQSDWVRNPIDAFLQRQHQQHGIKPQPEAPRIVLLRRLHLDLTGIPPTLEEIATCEADPSPRWYEQTVKRLLDDPRHGERWARHWMDVWRYSDWWGLGDQLRNSQKHIWHWRDWIVESLNADTPYDEMVRLMLAADELHPNDLSKLRASGYLARNYWLFNRPQWMEETVEHVSKGFLGLTMNCSRCHDHKYDPFEQTDYYRLRAFFEPYHVRLDIVPGEADLTHDGIPRAFDGLMEEPTYLYIRGDERKPDKSKVITPGVPPILAFDELKIEPVSLPTEAWQPERRPWVLDAYVSASRKRVEAAQSDLKKSQEKAFGAIQGVEKARKETAEAEKVASAVAGGTPLIADSFKTLDAKRWKLFGGEWVHEPGRLSQKKDGAMRSALRLIEKAPKDFDGTVRFTILGGSQWRSVGLSFDVSQDDPTQPPAATDSEQMVYVSAYSGGPKIQSAFHRGGEWQYPVGSAVRAMPIKLEQEYTLRVQARGTLINASLNGEPLITWESTLPRRDGALQVITFDAMAVIHEVKLSVLDPAISLRKPGLPPVNPPLTLEMAEQAATAARGDQAIAEAALAVAQAGLESVERRVEAQRAEWDPQHQKRQEKVAAAVRAERLVTVAQARHKVAAAEQTLQRAAADQKEAAEKPLKETRDALQKAIQTSEAAVQPTDTYAKFSGAMWTQTRFFNSGKDDPEVKFHPQSTGRRTALAKWIADRRNPLTARVAVNHIWTRHMGQPLVPTMFDFGRKGTPPTHPELLDWLASELIDSGWSMKHVHGLIADSAAYRMSSSLAGGDAAMARDPENHLLWRRVPMRMESQLVRDSLLSLAGTLDQTRGGPPVPSAEQATSQRRSLYFFHSNNERNLFLTTFDEALVKDCYRREQSIVPQQALALTNSQLALEAAEKIAQRLSENQPDDVAFARAAFRLVTGISPNQDEMAASAAALEAWKKLPGENDKSARMNLVWALINHNDFVTVR